LIPQYRRHFNNAYRDDVYRGALRRLEQDVGGPIPFRIAESPLFIPPTLLATMQSASEDIVRQLAAGASADAERRIPAGWLAPHEDAHPLFLQFDYALCAGRDGEVIPLVTEIQGFPSLYALQHRLAQIYRQAYGLPAELRHLCSGLDDEAFVELFRRAVLGGHAAENVVLLDVHPWQQGTWPDFKLTQQLCPGLAVVSATELHKRGRRLFYAHDGREVPIERIFNRVVWEDQAAHESAMRVSLQDDLEVEWAGHPNWFFRYSKLSLPFLRHPNVPHTVFLDEVSSLPADLENYVLKPLFSFSGKGLRLDLDRATLEAIPAYERAQYILQEKFHYADVIEAPEGRVRCEVRLMYVWLERLLCVTTLPRMSRGRVMGTAFNRSDPWTGHGLAFFPASR
jgi:hypothetical protein